jgi:hypothetical protein
MFCCLLFPSSSFAQWLLSSYSSLYSLYQPPLSIPPSTLSSSCVHTFPSLAHVIPSLLPISVSSLSQFLTTNTQPVGLPHCSYAPIYRDSAQQRWSRLLTSVISLTGKSCSALRMQQTAHCGCCTAFVYVAEITNTCSECILQLQTLIEQIWENIASLINLSCLRRDVCRVSSDTQNGTWNANI